MPSFLLTYRGELAALSAAFIWAIASMVYIRLGRRLTPSVLNLVKSSIAIVLVVLTLMLQGNGIEAIAPVPLGLLLLSGAIGIGFGDTVFFASLNCIGARRALLLEALAPPLTAIWLQQTAIKYTAAGIAQALSATSPLFVIPIALRMGDRVSPRAVLGVLIALAGIWLLFDK